MNRRRLRTNLGPRVRKSVPLGGRLEGVVPPPCAQGSRFGFGPCLVSFGSKTVQRTVNHAPPSASHESGVTCPMLSISPVSGTLPHRFGARRLGKWTLASCVKLQASHFKISTHMSKGQAQTRSASLSKEAPPRTDGTRRASIPRVRPEASECATHAPCPVSA